MIVTKKVRETGTSDRRPGSGRPTTAMIPDKMQFVMQRSMSERQMAAELVVAEDGGPIQHLAR